MAKRKQKTHQQNIEQQATRLTQTAAQTFNEGDLQQFHSHLTSLHRTLHSQPERLNQAETEIALAITDEGTPEAYRLAAFVAVVRVVGKLNRDNKWTVLGQCGIELIKFGQYKAAIAKFEQVLRLNPNHVGVLNNYGNALANSERYEEAIVIYEQVLNLNPNHVDVLNNYGNTLMNLERYEEAIAKYEHALRLNPNDVDALNNYGVTLADLERYEEAIEKYKQALQLNPSYIGALNNYGNALDELGRYEDAIEKYEHALQINPNDVSTLSNYGVTLANLERYEEADQKFEQILQKKPNYPFTLLVQATLVFEPTRQYEKAISNFERIISINTLDPNSQNFVYFTLGRLYYLTKSIQQGNHYFNLAIENSDDKDAFRLESAKNILSIKPYSENGVAILEEVIKTSPHYAETRRWLAKHTWGKKYFQLFNPPPNLTTASSTDEVTINDTTMLNRTIYHNIANEVALLKEIAYELKNNQPDNPTMAEIMTNLDQILEGIKERREAEKTKVQTIPAYDYDQIMDTIAKTAHDISDFVNNELAIIEEDVRVALETIAETNLDYQTQLADLLKQIKFTQAALNDLKTINEGLKLTYQRFPISLLFEKWLNTPTIANAIITIEIKNPDSIFIGDLEKLKSFLNELVENSLKHNPDKPNLQITMSSQDVELNERQQLHLIYRDDGQGIPPDKKDWVFLPLKTTSPMGSGLGLFSIKRTLNAMPGTIEESGTTGVQFEITLPYQNGEMV